MAVDAFLGFGNLRRVIAFFIESRGCLEDFFRTELNAVSAPLAAVFDNMHDTSRYDNLLGIKGHSPEIHGFCSPMAYMQKVHDMDFSLKVKANDRTAPLLALF
jgi:hypothetical protein